ncbi:MAG: nucleotidyl transferase AbiEii/AbiGii toxin family protein [Candidatus Omnitrophica bacterium]|nr:nucleotidyl transferase AbiEii/AbiGii toxin family protein [Candidatus Omnitrophota bacterium]MCB9747929.1 nucleotidyl transferase AbiEii/AbiGii toxin family protein [Candidatus Omnitrophota bacterium]
MDKVARLPQKERDDLFNETASRKNGISFSIIEKDFWVCWVLNKIFSLEQLHSNMIFKGGTSLSKVFNVINRFSEDVDLSISKECLGFKDKDYLSAKMSGKEIKRRLDDLQIKCKEYITTELFSLLENVFNDVLGKDLNWSLEIDPEDHQTVLFTYPRTKTREEKGQYIKPSVRLELGARSDHWPSSENSVISFAAEEFPQYFEEPTVTVKTLSLERTFWEKATLLHAEFHRPESSKLPPRFSRHYYDLALMIQSGKVDALLKDLSLLDTVREHKKLFYKSSWAKYDQAKKGTLRLAPKETRFSALKHDYQLMQEMIYSSAPSFEEILGLLKSFEDKINAL